MRGAYSLLARFGPGRPQGVAVPSLVGTNRFRVINNSNTEIVVVATPLSPYRGRLTCTLWGLFMASITIEVGKYAPPGEHEDELKPNCTCDFELYGKEMALYVLVTMKGLEVAIIDDLKVRAGDLVTIDSQTIASATSKPLKVWVN